MAIGYTDRESLRKTLREINLKDYKRSEACSTISEGQEGNDPFGASTVTEERLLDVIQYLNAPSGRGNKTNMDVFVEHRRGTHKMDLRGTASSPFTDDYMKEKIAEERAYYGTNMPMGSSPDKPAEKPQTLDDIKARYLQEMEALTKKYQDEINNLR